MPNIWKRTTRRRVSSSSSSSFSLSSSSPLLVWFFACTCFLLSCCPLLHTESSPLLGSRGSSGSSNPHRRARDRGELCSPHQSVAQLIKSSPVIVKALGARIFTDADLAELQPDLMLLLQQQQQQQQQQQYSISEASESKASNRNANDFATSSTFVAQSAATTTSSTTTTTTTTTTALPTTSGVGGMPQGGSVAARRDSILITLTPETVYKGASLLKMTPSGERTPSHMDTGGSGSGGGGGGGAGGNGGTSESAYQYEGQLNATLRPLACFDENILSILPTELIVFGKLVNPREENQQQQQPFDSLQLLTMSQRHASLLSSSSGVAGAGGMGLLTTGGGIDGGAEEADVLRISINGLHRWSAQFENYIWKHLGWDDWSDFTVCSITCGKGVQQRFRRCLLDNPAMNMNAVAADEAAEDDGVEEADLEESLIEDGDDLIRDEDDEAILIEDIGGGGGGQDDIVADEEIITGEEDEEEFNESSSSMATTAAANTVYEAATEMTSLAAQKTQKNNPTMTPSVSFVSQTQPQPNDVTLKSSSLLQLDAMADNNMQHDRIVTDANAMTEEVLAGQQQQQQDTVEAMRVFEAANEARKARQLQRQLKQQKQKQQQQQKKKRRKFAKTVSTLFCEGYNIEQRNCNTFECSDDISDLLKFYKRYPEDVANTAAVVAASDTVVRETPPATTTTTTTITTAMVTENRQQDETVASHGGATMPVLSTNDVATAATTGGGGGVGAVGDATMPTRHVVAGLPPRFPFFGTAKTTAMAPATMPPPPSMAGGSNANNSNSNSNSIINNNNRNVNFVTSNAPMTTPSNLGFVRSWRNALNFTLMLTLRVKNDSRATATVFSVRNATHNLYLESCREGVRLYLERDNGSEMLPVKFNLFDYRWHQVAISIQNGDFISIYVDCLWTNSFVVSKRLFSLPLNADVEIGRGFNGELQQLLVLPNNQERLQCSHKRTSINEVKRYIIDTFIGDYAN